jgi:hypothetical protein
VAGAVDDHAQPAARALRIERQRQPRRQLERVLDKGVVIAGDIRINLLDIELLTVKLRLIVASVDKAKEMGIDWWETDPALSSGARRDELARENAELRERLAELEPGRAQEEGS